MCLFVHLLLFISALICISATIKFLEVSHYTVIILLYQILPNSSFWLLQTSIAFNMKPLIWFWWLVRTVCRRVLPQRTWMGKTHGGYWRHGNKKSKTSTRTHTRARARESLMFSSVGHQHDRILGIRSIVSLCHSLWDSSSRKIHNLWFSSLERHLGTLQCFITVG